MGTEHSTTTILLERVRDGDERARDELLTRTYDELVKLARGLMAHEKAGVSLQATDLVHEAAAKLMGSEEWNWENRQHFFGVAANAMRRLLVDRARARNAVKRGGDRARVNLETEGAGLATPAEDVMGIDEELDKLGAINPRAARIVELRFFGGLKMSEVAGVLGIAESVAYVEWAYARAWLFRQLSDGRGG